VESRNEKEEEEEEEEEELRPNLAAAEIKWEVPSHEAFSRQGV
jgi:hypothetical protein